MWFGGYGEIDRDAVFDHDGEVQGRSMILLLAGLKILEGRAVVQAVWLSVNRWPDE